MPLVSAALEVGRSLQKKQTGFVHYCPESDDAEIHDTIPVYENALFAFSLFRSRLADNVLEGKELLEKLLAFEVDGNFPVYLHEYPRKQDPFLLYRLAPIFFWVVRDFSHVIGELKGKLQTLLEKLGDLDSSYPNWVNSRILAFRGELGDVPTSLFEWGEELITLQIAAKMGASIEERIRLGASLWHPQLGIYTGKELRKHQLGQYPAPSLFSLFYAQWSKEIAPYLVKRVPLHLRAALIRPLSFALPLPSQPLPYVQYDETSETPLFIGWVGEKAVHTAAFAKKHCAVEKKGEDLIITYPEELPETEDKSFEWSFFLDHSPDHAITIDGVQATTFHAGDILEITSCGVRISLSFRSDEGTFTGHIMRGNRPSQHACKGKDHFQSFDWRVALRTIERKPGARLQVQVRSQKMQESPPTLPSHASHCPHTG